MKVTKTMLVRWITNLRPLLLSTAMLAAMCVEGLGQKLEIELDTHEGNLLQQIDNEKDQAKKVALLQSFAKSFPNHEAVTWVLTQLQAYYLETNDHDRVLEMATRILGIDPTELSAAHNALKAAEAKKDVALIKIWSSQTSQLARRNMQLKKPEYGDDSDVAEWKVKVEYARQVDQYSEYSLYFASVQAKDPGIKTNLIEALEQRNPMSEYLAQMRTAHTAMYRQVDVEEAVAAAEADFRNGVWNEDALLMVATHLMSRRRDPDKVIQYSQRIIEIMSSKPRPEDVSETEWERKRRNMLGSANWMAGVLSSSNSRYQAADKYLRAALPHLRNSDMLAGAYYHLGFVNFRMAEAGERVRIHDAIRFTKDCISINSAVQFQASENLKAMKAEYGLQD